MAAFGAGTLWAAKARWSRTRVSAITDEMAVSQSAAVRAAREFGFESVELRNVPESGKPFAGLSAPELKRWASELAANKLKVSILHVPAGIDFVSATGILGAGAVWTSEPNPVYPRVMVDAARLNDITSPGIAGAWTPREDWQEAWRRLPRTRIASVRVATATLDRQNPKHLSWKGILEMLQKDGYGGTITVETGAPPSDAALESILELIHLIGQVA